MADPWFTSLPFVVPETMVFSTNLCRLLISMFNFKKWVYSKWQARTNARQVSIYQRKEINSSCLTLEGIASWSSGLPSSQVVLRSCTIPASRLVEQTCGKARHIYVDRKTKVPKSLQQSQGTHNVPCWACHSQAEGIVKTTQFVWSKEFVVDVNLFFIFVEFLHYQLL